MISQNSGYKRLLVYLAVMAALVIGLLPHGAAAIPTEQGRSRTFAETNQTV